MKLNFVFIFLILLCFSCKNKIPGKRAEACNLTLITQKTEKVSLTDLSRIKSLDGKLVEIEGYYRCGFEETALCPDKKADAVLSLWIDKLIVSSEEYVCESFNEKKVILTGKINLAKKGHLNAYMAGVDSVVCIKEVN